MNKKIIDFGRWKVLEGDSSFPQPDIRIQKELYALTPPDWFRPPTPRCRVLDIGAYVGDSTRYYLDCGAEVTAIEAYPDAFECLKHNCPEANCLNLIAGDGYTSVKLTGETDHSYPHHVDNYGTRGVGLPDTSADYAKSASMDGLALGRFDLVKIDVEGFEWAVMDGMRLGLKTHRPVIIVEVFNSMLAKFGKARSDVLRHLPESYRVEVGVGRWEDDRCDLICVPKEMEYPLKSQNPVNTWIE